MRILIAEDDELTAQTLIAILTHQNHVVEIAVNGQTAWDLIRTFSYDLMLLSVTIPDLDGVSLCRRIRSRGLQTPILLMTDHDSCHEKAIGLDAGADDYMVKPLDEEELEARVRALLRRGKISSQPVLEWGLLQLDPTSCEVTYNHELLSLTPKEYALLELFLRNSRRVFSCGVILEHLWAFEEMPGEEAVRTHIKGLRQKLKAAGAPGDWIETVYGIGYRLKPLEADDRIHLSTLRAAADSEDMHAMATQQPAIAPINSVWKRLKDWVKEQTVDPSEMASQTTDLPVKVVGLPGGYSSSNSLPSACLFLTSSSNSCSNLESQSWRIGIMSLMQWQPFKDLDTLRQQMNHLFDELTHRPPESAGVSPEKGSLWAPAIELQETDTDVILKAAIPGIAAQDLDVRVGETSVSISGEHQEETKTEKQGFFHSELRYGNFHRVVPLPVAVQNQQVVADFKDGLLTLTMPKVNTAQQNMVKVDLAMEQKLRDATTERRLAEEHRQEQVHTRISADLGTQPNGMKEEARELTAAQRLQEEELQDKVHTRVTQEVNAPTVS